MSNAKLLRVDVESASVNWEAVPEYLQPWGGRGLTSSLVNQEVPPTCDAIGKHNKLVFAPGLLGGTTAPTSGRLSVGGKSPLTGSIKESNAGGIAGSKLVRSGIKALVLEGLPRDRSLKVLVVSPSDALLVDGERLRGLGNYEVAGILRSEYGQDAAVISIGPAGENRMRAASIAVTDREGRPTRHAARGGLGAVMGSKGIKAIVVDARGHGTLDGVADKKRFQAAVKGFAGELTEHPFTGKVMPLYGTSSTVTVIDRVAGLPVRNFRTGKFDELSQIDENQLIKLMEERGGNPTYVCQPGCVVRCSNIYHGPDGKYLTASLEYETIVMMGCNLGIADFDAIATLDRLCDDFGLDTIEIGAALGVAADAGLMEFGDGEAAIRLVKEIGAGTPLGRILGGGAKNTGDAFGITRVAHVKRQAIPAYDPRTMKGTGVTMATSPMGADHTAGNALPGTMKVDLMDRAGQAKLAHVLQVRVAALDTIGLCLFVNRLLFDSQTACAAVVEMINAKLGLSITFDDYLEMGHNVLRTEREFNRRAGFTAAHDRFPDFLYDEPLPPKDMRFDITQEDLDEAAKASA
ncbi:MAG: aldehyde ferredoxin oxidoreductase [Chloroflexi bacterium]|nr:aldehyde ferredoxin oxidoreductase [Chloroflexota bacterium]